MTGNGGGDFINSGTIVADGATSQVQFAGGVRITGGTLSSVNGGSILTLASNAAFLTDVINAGNLSLANGANLHLNGTITNSGVIALNATNIATRLSLDSDTTLAGGGTLTLASFNSQSNAGVAGLFLLTNVNNLIQGEGSLGLNETQFLNQANGIVSANVTGRTLVVDPSGNGFLNQGLLQASNGGILLLTGNGGGDFNNSGTIAALSGGIVRFNGIVNSTGIVDIGANTLTATGTYAQTGATSEFRLAGGSAQSNNALNFQDGLIDAWGTMTAAIQNNAILRPALGGTGLAVTGNVSLLSGSRLVFQLGGLTQGSQYGFLNVNGTVSLGGQLMLSFVNGFQNTVTGANTFTLLTSSNAFIGAFANIASGSRLTTSDGFGSFLVTYNGSNLILSNFISGSGPTLVTANWLNPADGTWITPANWSSNPNFPNNGTPANTVYNAVINATGVPYTVTLASAVTVQGFTLDSNDATLSLNGGAILQTTDTSSVQAGNLLMNGGILRGGTLNLAGGALSFSNNSNNRLDGVTVNGNFDLGVSHIARLQNGTQLNGVVTLSGNSSTLALDQSSVLNTALTVNMDAASNARLTVEGNNTPTLGANVLVRGAGTIGQAVIVGGTNGLTNQGTITADRSGLTLSIQPDSFSNTGTLNASNGGILNVIATNWTSSGTINANNAIVNFGGTFTTAGLGAINATTSTLNITGTMNNTGNSYTLPASAGAFTVNGGRILGGTLNVGTPGAASLFFSTNSNNRLDGVTVNGNFDLSGTSATARLQNGTQINGVVTLSGNSSTLALDQSSVLNTALTVNMDAASNARLTVEGNNTPTLGANVLVRGAGTIGSQVIVGGTNGLTNQGTITADRSGLTLTIQPDSFTNTGTLNASNGGILNVIATNWTSSGTINASNAIVNFGGTFTTAGLGPINATASTLNITGTMNNTGNSYTLPASAGAFTVSGGRILGGTLNVGTPGAASLLFSTSSNNRLDGVTVNGNFDLSGTSATARLQNGTQLNGVVTLSGNSSLLALDQSSVLSGTLTVNMDATSNARLSVEGNNTPTLGANVLVRGAGTIGSQVIVGGTNGLTNQGTITADRSGLTLTIQPDSFTNTGTLNASNGGILNVIATNWTSSGTINASNAIVNFGGTFTTTGLGAINATASTLNITGTMNNSGNAYTLPASAGAFTVNGGRILGGTLNVGTPGAASLLFSTSSNNRLDGVMMNGDFDLSGTSATARLQNGTQLNGVVTLSGNSSLLALDQSSVLSGTLTVNMDATSNARLSVEGNNTPTLGANVLVRGAGTIGQAVIVGGTNGLTNQGTITADRSGLTLSIQPDSFSNTGTLNASNGGILNVIATNWTSSGTINASNAIVNFGGTFTTAGLGPINATASTLNITGTMNNTGNSYTLPASAGAFTVNGGRILGGTLNVGTPGAASLLFSTSSNNRLDGVMVNGDFDLSGTSATARLQNGTQLNGVVTLSGNSSLLALDQSSVLSGTLTVNMDATSNARLSVEGNNTPTLGGNVLVRERGSIGQAAIVGGTNSLTNQGTITADRSGLTLSIQPDSFSNTGTLNASNGGILNVIATNWTSSGTINANNAIVNFGGTFTTAGLGAINATTSTLNITGTMNNTGNSYTLPASAGAFTVNGGRIPVGR